MTTKAGALVGVRPRGGDIWLLASVLAVALLTGALATREPLYATAAVLGAGLVVLVARDVAALPIFLVFTMFVESVALGPGLRIGRIAGAIALVALAYHVLSRGAGGLRPNALLVACGAFGCWMLLSVYWAEEPSAVYRQMFSYLLAIAYMLTFAVVVRTPRQLKAVFGTLAIGSLVFGVISFVSYLALGEQYLDDGLGAVGLQGDKNYFAVYQVVALPAALTLAALERRSRRQLLYYAVVAAIVLSVVASLSRTGLVVLAGAVLLTLVSPTRFFFRSNAQKLTYVSALAVAAVVVSVAGATPFLERVRTVFEDPSFTGQTTTGRSDLWRAAWSGYSEEPLLGLGAGNFAANALDLLQRTPGVDRSAQYVQKGIVAHNIYLETLTDLGPVGLALLLAVLGLTTRYFVTAFRRAREADDRTLQLLSVALLVSLLAFSLSGIFLSNQLEKPLWILIGLALALDVITRERMPAPTLAATDRREAAPPPRVDVRAPAQPRVWRQKQREPYDLAVSERSVDPREQRVTEQVRELRSEREGLERLRALLAMRERRVESRAEELEALAREYGAITRVRAEFEARERAVDGKEGELRAVEADLRARADALEVKERAYESIENLRDRLAEQERRLRFEDTGVRTRERELAARAVALDEREAELARRSVALDEREAHVSAVEAAAAEHEGRLDARRRETQLAKEAIAAREQALDVRVAEVAEREGGLAALEQDDSVRRAELETQTRELQSADEALAARDRMLEARATELTTRQQELASRERALDESLEARRREVEAAAEALAASEQAIRTRTGDLDELEARHRAREEELTGREHDLASRERALAETLDAQSRGLDETEARQREREQELARREEALEEAFDARAHDLARREQAVSARARELDRPPDAPAADAPAPERVAPEWEDAVMAPGPAVTREPVREPVESAPAAMASAPRATEEPEAADERRPISLEDGADLNLNVLAQLVTRFSGDFPDRAEEWTYYVLYLREYATADGRLPESFNLLVHDVFGDLLERARSSR